MKYRRRPVEVEAVQWNGQPVSELPEWVREMIDHTCDLGTNDPKIITFNGPVNLGDWFAKCAIKRKTMTDAEFRAAIEPME